MITTGVILGAGASVVSGGAATGINNMAAAMPAMGTIHGASASLKLIKGMGKK